jgi:ferredoxin
MATLLTSANLRALVGRALSQQYRVVGPRREGALTLLAPLASPAELCLDELMARNSIKEFFFPRCEAIFHYTLAGGEVTVSEPADFPPTLIIGSRACDAASLERLDRLFGWDYRDSFYFKRREASTVVTVVCDRHDEACFCTSVGLQARSSAGSDILLVPLATGEGYLVEAVSAKGEERLREWADLFTAGEPGAERTAAPPVRFDQAQAREFLAENFEHSLWQEQFRACLGCGTCAYLCPVCHCFDIVDEGSLAGGARLKNWDSCQFALFTRHTSGHNPRPSQAARWRQRLRHKFLYYPDRFGAASCVGGGRCERACPVGISIRAPLQAMAGAAASVTSDSARGD